MIEMMTLVAGLMGGLGLICMISRKSLVGMLIGVQILLMGAALIFVLSGLDSAAKVQGHVAGLVIVLGGVAQVVGGFALAIRMFFLKDGISMDELRSLKR